MLPVPRLHRRAGSWDRSKTPPEMDVPGAPARRRLRQRPTPTPVPASDVIELDSSSDDFAPSAGSASDDSDVEAIRKGKKKGSSATSSAPKRGFKRLRRPSSDSNSSHGAVKAVETADRPEIEWECVRCTYLNEPQRVSCELCLTVRATPKATRKLSAWLTATPGTGVNLQRKKALKKDTSLPAVEMIDSSDEDCQVSFQHPKSSGIIGQGNDFLWTDDVSAEHVEDLCVQKKKVQEVQEWLQQSLPSRNSTHKGTKRLLFLCGPPGSGKSTTVRHLAKAMGVTIKEWRDNSSAGKLQFHRHLQDDFQISQQSPWDDFIDFINRSVNYSALQVAAIPESRARRRPVSPSSHDLLNCAGSSMGQLILIESWPLNPFGKGQDSSIWDEKLKIAFQQVVSSTTNLQYPVICIFSDVRDKKIDQGHLARLFSDEVMRSPSTSIINFNPVTTVQMKKTLTKTIERQNWKISPADLTKIIESSDGDVRHAINMTQFMARQKNRTPQRGSSKKRDKKSSEDSNIIPAEENSSRDPFYSDFHVVGKLLHSKNKMGDGSSRLMEFDRILDSSVMSLDRILSLLHSNCVDYFTEVDDLNQALELMSISEMWLHESYHTSSSSSAFRTSHDLVRSILVRSISLTNEHPAPSAFRPITAPRMHETSRRMVASRQDALLEQQQLFDSSSFPYYCRGDVYAFEVQPFVEKMRACSGSQVQANRSLHALDVTIATTDIIDDDIESDGDAW